MKILFVEPHESSLFSFRKELLDSLIKEGHEIVLCIESTNKVISEYSHLLKIVNVPMNLKDKSVLSNIRLKNAYKKIIKEERPDIILSYKIKPNIYCGLYAKRIPMIANITGLGNIFKSNGLLSRIGIMLYKRSFKNVSCVFFQNEDSYQFFCRHKIPVHNYRIIPGSGVNTQIFLPSPIPDGETINFLFASRAIREKGFFLLVDAIPFVIEKNHNVHFNFLNAEEDINSIPPFKFLLEEYKEFVSVLPRSNDIQNIYENNDYLVSPSYYREGLSNVLLESLACARPIITTNDNPGCKEALVEGVNGFGIKSNNLQNLVDVLILASQTTKERIKEMGLNGRAFVTTKFDRKLVIKEYIDVINSLTAKR